jgi:hypothetical protein
VKIKFTLKREMQKVNNLTEITRKYIIEVSEKILVLAEQSSRTLSIKAQLSLFHSAIF